MIAKVALQKIRQLAKRGTNQTLTRAIEEVYLAGMEAGARALSEQLKGRINDLSQNHTQQEPDEAIPSLGQHDTEVHKPEASTT